MTHAAYDKVNQLTPTTKRDDAAGNRTSVGGSWARTGLPLALASATYDGANRLTAWGSTSLTYDLNGNLIADGTTSYTWNVRDQLTGLSAGASASFKYDGLGRRRGKTVSSTTTNFLYDGLNLVQELTGGGTPTGNLLTGVGIDEVFTRTDAGGTSTLLTDALGSTLALTDGSGTVQTSYTYDAFGATSASGATSTNPGQFTGRENDSTGLYFYRARFYNPQLQRFVSEDPLGFAGGLNLFTYAANQPTGFVDPLGLKPSPGLGDPPGGPGGSGPGGPGSPRGPGGGPPSPPNWPRDWPPPGCTGRCLDDWLNAHPDAIKLGMMPLAPGGLRFTVDQDALIQLGKEAKQLGGVTEDAADIVKQWAKELGIEPTRGPEIHPGRNFDIPHFRIGPVNHIPVK